MEEEYKTYQPKWEEKKAESEKNHHHHHHHHHSYGYSSKSSRWSIDFAGWLKQRDKQAWIGLLIIVVIAASYGTYKVYSMYREDFTAVPHGDDRTEVDVDPLGDDMKHREIALEKGAELAEKANVDTIVKPVTGEYHNVYRPARKNDNVTIDDREWSKIKQNIRRWFRANGRDWKFILGVTALGLFIIGLAIYGIYKHKHPHGHYRL